MHTRTLTHTHTHTQTHTHTHTDCDLIVHKHCEDRAPSCKAQIESGNYVTMSRKKVVKSLEDLDDLGKFLVEKVTHK